jgi:hypothetical protein
MTFCQCTLTHHICIDRNLIERAADPFYTAVTSDMVLLELALFIVLIKKIDKYTRFVKPYLVGRFIGPLVKSLPMHLTRLEKQRNAAQYNSINSNNNTNDDNSNN